LRAVGDRRDRRRIARHDGAGIARAVDRRRLVSVDAEAGGATGLLTRAHAFGDVAGDGVVAGGEPCGCDGGGRVGSGDVASADAPGVGGFFFRSRLLAVAVTVTGSPGKMFAG